MGYVSENMVYTSVTILLRGHDPLIQKSKLGFDIILHSDGRTDHQKVPQVGWVWNPQQYIRKHQATETLTVAIKDKV